jgi:hypothetical protein
MTGYGDTGLTPGTTYWYRVAAYNSAGTSAWSNVAGAMTTPLPTPTRTATATPSRTATALPTLTVTPIPSATIAPPTVTRTPTATSTPVPPTATSTPVPPTSTAIPTATATPGPPNAPFALTAVPNSTTPGAIDLNWSYDPALGPPPTGFYAWRCASVPDALGNCPTGWVLVADIPLTPIAMAGPIGLGKNKIAAPLPSGRAPLPVRAPAKKTLLYGFGAIGLAALGYYVWKKRRNQ